MAIYSLRMTNIKRSDGRSAVGASAYRARANLKDDRTGKSYCYSSKQDLLFNQIYSHIDLPENLTSLYQLWNKAEETEKRVNSVVAREFLIALPKELTGQQNIELTEEIAKTLVDRFQFVAQASIHNEKDDEKGNIHLHLLTTTRKITADGFNEKIRELDTIRNTEALTEVRETVSNIINKYLELNSINQRVDHRKLEVQREEAEKNKNIEKVIELSRLPQVHIGKKKNDENKQRNEQIAQINNELKDEMRLIYFPKLLVKSLKKMRKYVAFKKKKTIFEFAKSLGIIVKPMSKKKLRKVEERKTPSTQPEIELTKNQDYNQVFDEKELEEPEQVTKKKFKI